MKQTMISIIRLYQRTLSPDHGVFAPLTLLGCRYFPSCSEYAIQSLHRFGLLKGAAKSLWRILRCNPWSSGGVDEP